MDSLAAQAAADLQDEENKRYRRRRYARHMLSGVLWFTIGLALTSALLYEVVASSGHGTFIHISARGGMLYGAGDFLYGLYGWLEETCALNWKYFLRGRR